jgi:hypothetical protein
MKEFVRAYEPDAFSENLYAASPTRSPTQKLAKTPQAIVNRRGMAMDNDEVYRILKNLLAEYVEALLNLEDTIPGAENTTKCE